jgi:asparagine synthase (glutamine-hydrolysing)
LLASRKLNPQRLKAFTLAVDGGGGDLDQARDFLTQVGLSLYLEAIEVPAARLDARRAVQLIEDYKPLDVQAATMLLALVEGIRARYPAWKQLVDGDGGDENLKDYPIEENPELTIRSVLNNLMLYQEGWGVGSLKHSLTYSGGQSRSYVRTWAPLKALGFEGFSPYTRPPVIAVAEGIPFIQLTEWSVPALYSLKGEIVSRGVREVTGMSMPVFEKRRFQHGAIASDGFTRHLSGEESVYRRWLDEAYG